MDVKGFIHLWDRPQVGNIRGLPPPVALRQGTWIHNTKSTVATLSGIGDLFRLLFSCAGHPSCPDCGVEISALTPDQIADRIMQLQPGTRFTIMAPLSHSMESGLHRETLSLLRKEGFLRIRTGNVTLLLDNIPADHEFTSPLELVIDRLIMKPGILSRLTDSLNLALKWGKDMVSVHIVDPESGYSKTVRYTDKMICPKCGTRFPDLTPKLFSRFHPDGMCPECNSDTGRTNLTMRCPKCMDTGLNAFARTVTFNQITFTEMMQQPLDKICAQLRDMVSQTAETVSHLPNPEAVSRIIKALLASIKPVIDLGLGYIEPCRSIPSLSGGEIQRLRLAGLTGRNLSGILYILDEPTAGLHPREQEALWQCLTILKNQGNTVLVVEHDLDFIRKADWVIEIGPGAGKMGGEILFSGPPGDLENISSSTTAPYLKKSRHLRRFFRPQTGRGSVILKNLTTYNLKGCTATFPLGLLVCVTGVSGSGKSALAVNELLPTLKAAYAAGSLNSVNDENSLLLSDNSVTVPKPLLIDQRPLAPSGFSMPATYMGIFNRIRDLLAKTPDARAHGYKSGFFSLRRKGGRCERCMGRGMLKLNLRYIPPMKVRCDLCSGLKYNREALAVRYRGLNCAEILEMTVSEAADFFARIPSIKKPLETVERIGLGYLPIGQPAETLSGGEAQRLKLARELSKKTPEPAIYIMDEPSRGLHLTDLERFIAIMDDLLEQGHSIVIVEHQLEILAIADWIIEMGPGGGPDGGRIIVQGQPAQISQNRESVIGPHLKKTISAE